MVQRLTEFDTIAAISTPLGEGGISIVRVSGEDAVAIVNRLFKGKDLEKIVLSRAIWWHLQHRVLVYSNKTVIFD